MVITTQRSHPYISICGPVASGKTSLAKALASRFGWSTLLEDLDAHPYFNEYYSDMRRWGFHTVVTFLIRALTLQDHIAVRLATEALCQDWYVAEHYAIWGIHTFDEGIIDERERQVCEELHRYLMAHLTTPDLVIVLMADPATLLTRVARRQRPTEDAIPRSYIENLVQRYHRWIKTLEARHIIVDSAVDDFVNDDQALGRIIMRVEDAMR